MNEDNNKENKIEEQSSTADNELTNKVSMEEDENKVDETSDDDVKEEDTIAESSSTAEEADDANSENTEQPSLHWSNFEPSESNTTNIPPRLPMGYSYSETPTPTNNSNNKKKTTVTSHPDLPDTQSTAQSKANLKAKNKRYQRKHKANTGKSWLWLKKHWLMLLLVFIVVAIGATYSLWLPIVNQWRVEKEEVPAVAADTMPLPEKVKVDTLTSALSHEDSVRIQDSIRHAKWLYWKRRKQAQQQKEQNEEVTDETNNGVNGPGAANAEHTQVHANDSTHH